MYTGGGLWRHTMCITTIIVMIIMCYGSEQVLRMVMRRKVHGGCTCVVWSLCKELVVHGNNSKVLVKPKVGSLPDPVARLCVISHCSAPSIMPSYVRLFVGCMSVPEYLPYLWYDLLPN